MCYRRQRRQNKRRINVKPLIKEYYILKSMVKLIKSAFRKQTPILCC